MSDMAPAAEHQINKRHVEATVLFAINHLPQLDRATLEKFLELVNTTGNFGSISSNQLATKMDLVLKYVPGASECSLRALAELLGVRPSSRNRPLL